MANGPQSGARAVRVHRVTVMIEANLCSWVQRVVLRFAGVNAISGARRVNAAFQISESGLIAAFQNISESGMIVRLK